ncbi:MAG TPA: SDR family NAD(P)-dependent oxidoreductase [Jatrophihabitans sp.]|nr:SDR family NAD(P)-dependent oxidoreductase [Jatrophihabitans sp.]
MTGQVPIAVVGLACHYPDADSPAELWNTVLGRRRAFRAIPPERLSADYLGEADDPDRTYLSAMAVLAGWQFDRRRFQVPAAVYQAVDPAHWLALQTSAEALADAGFAQAEGLDRDRVGVVVGNSLTGEFSRASQLRYRLPFLNKVIRRSMAEAGADLSMAEQVLRAFDAQLLATFAEPTDETLAGALSNTIAGRICNHFDLGAGGYTIDGACSSSLLAVITGCRSLAAGELDMVLAGGVDLSLDPLELVGFARLGALARGPMRVFDAEPTGFLPGEGCGMLVLMRADEARRRGLRQYAELHGWGVSSDGAGGITRPEAAGQARAMLAAYRHADLDPAQVRYLEGHGTGTAVGDAVELEALNRVRGRAPGVLGSIKANIGHTKAAAGAASLIKTVLAVHRRVIPPSTGVRSPHPLMSPEVSGLTAPPVAAAWPVRDSWAAVSSMGFGGINCHLVLSGESGRAGGRLRRPEAAPTGRPGLELLALAAPEPDQLGALLAQVAERARRWSLAEFEDIALSTNRSFNGLSAVRCVLVAERPDELAEVAAKAAARLVELRPTDRTPIVDEGAGFALGAGRPPRIGLLFPGQAAPVRGRLSDWAAGLPAIHAAANSPEPGPDDDPDTARAQPAVIRQSLAALAWLERAGVQPVAVLGHSVGELAAMAAAGMLRPAEALRLAEQRGALMAALGRSGTGMLAISADAATVQPVLAGTGATIACQNGPSQTVVAGSDADLALVRSAATGAGLETARLNVSHGFHSAAMQAVPAAIAAVLAEIEFDAPDVDLISTVTGAAVGPADDPAALLMKQLVAPVRFADALAVLANRCDLLVEAGPGHTLSGLARDCVDLPVLSCDAGGAERTGALTMAALAAAGVASPRNWRGPRAFRHRRLDEEIQLLGNPCETALTAVAVPPVVEPAPPTEPAPAGLPPMPEPTRPPSIRPSAPAGPGRALDLLRTVLADRVELPAALLEPGCSPLRDLHISSLEVRRCVTQVCAQLDRSAPSSALALSDATLGELAEVIDGLPAGSQVSAGDDRVPGVRAWLAAFEHYWTDWQPSSSGPPDPSLVEIRLRSTEESALLAELAELPGRLAGSPRLLLRHRGQPGAAGLARSIAVEAPQIGVTVLDESAGRWTGPAAELAAGPGEYQELRIHAGGLQRLASRRREPGPVRPVHLEPDELVLVTGGAAGITARCAAVLAARDGCRLVVLGRSPATHPAARTALAELRATGAEVRYASCDVTDAGAVSTLVARLRAEANIAGLVHGAAVNEPAPLAAVDAGSLARAWRPKVIGLQNLLDATGDSLRLLVGFGSIIGRFGLPGQADYAVANDGLRVTLERWAAERPACRVRVVEWSVWAELGMGLRMGVLDELRRRGVEPIRPADGIAMFTRLIDDEAGPITSLATGRFPPTSTARLTGSADTDGRFLENLVLHLPATELVADSELSYGDDLYLADHEIQGGGVLPAVLVLEAFAQAAGLLGLPAGGVVFEQVSLTSPVDVGPDDRVTLRVAALSTEPDRYELVARCDSDDYAANRVSALLRPMGSMAADRAPAVPPPGLSADRPSPLYGQVLFHRGRLRRVLDYQLLTAFRLRAWVHSDALTRWFSGFHSGRLRLGDPGALDAMLQVLLPAVPLRLALPVACERIEIPPASGAGALLVEATELSHTADEFTFDVSLSRPDGRLVARWTELRLRAVAERKFGTGLPLPLVGPWLSRLAAEAGVADGLLIASGPGERGDVAATALLEAITGRSVRHTPEGRPTLSDGAAQRLSASYLPSALLAGAAERPFGLDWQRPADLTESAWGDCLGTADLALAGQLQQAAGYRFAVACTMIWCAREAVRKAVGDEGGPLALLDRGPAGSQLLQAGELSLLGAPVTIAELGEVVCVLAVAGGSR